MQPSKQKNIILYVPANQHEPALWKVLIWKDHLYRHIVAGIYKRQENAIKRMKVEESIMMLGGMPDEMRHDENVFWEKTGTGYQLMN